MYRTDPIVSDVPGFRQYKLSIGPLEVCSTVVVLSLIEYSNHLQINIFYEPLKQAVLLQLYLSLPILDTVLIGGATGSLNAGAIVNTNFGRHFAGDVGIKRDGKHILLYFDFSAFGHAWREPGHVLFDITGILTSETLPKYRFTT